MPGVHYDTCLDHTTYLVKRVGVDPVELETMWHFDECDLTNLYRDGFWRWFGSSLRCNCVCHQLELNEDEVAKQDLKVKVAGWSMVLIVLATITFIIMAG